jgi:hypothetical protein
MLRNDSLLVSLDLYKSIRRRCTFVQASKSMRASVRQGNATQDRCDKGANVRVNRQEELQEGSEFLNN